MARTISTITLCTLFLLLLPRDTLTQSYRLSITHPKPNSSHHLFLADSSTTTNPNRSLEISIVAVDIQPLLSSSSPSDVISVCCQWHNLNLHRFNGSRCVQTQVKALSSYFNQHNHLDLQIYLPWENLVSMDPSNQPNRQTNTDQPNQRAPTHHPRPQTIHLHVGLSNAKTHYTMTSPTTVIYYHGTVTPSSCLKAPSYVINMARNTNRWTSTQRRLNDAGYSNINKWKAIDGSAVSIQTVEDQYNIKWGSANHRACSASHTSLWSYLVRHVVRTGGPLSPGAGVGTAARAVPLVTTIFEDDALPHEDFIRLFPKYLSNVPSDADIIYIGWQRGAIQSKGQVHVDPPTEKDMPYVLKRHPACLHAYMVTRQALLKLLPMVLPLHDTIDGKLMRLEWEGKLNAYAFNGMKHVSAMLTTDRIKKKSMKEYFVALNMGKEKEEEEEEEEEDVLSFDGDTDTSTAELVVSGECPSGECPRLVVSRMDRSRGIIFQDASFGTDIDAEIFLDQNASPLSRYSKERHDPTGYR
jgi:GR25 family glycosyltransferase involved in LPS biosynthesis